MNELLKQRLQFAAMGFNLTVMLFMLVRSFQGLKISWAWYTQQALIGAGMGLIVAAIIFYVTRQKT